MPARLAKPVWVAPGQKHVTDTPDTDDTARVRAGLAADNQALVGPSGRQALAVFARAEGGSVQAGLLGFTAWKPNRKLGELYRRQGAWKFRAVGQGWASGLAGLAYKMLVLGSIG